MPSCFVELYAEVEEISYKWAYLEVVVRMPGSWLE